MTANKLSGEDASRTAESVIGQRMILLNGPAQTVELPDTAYYQGCRSWVELERELPTEGATPVLTEERMRDLRRSLDLLLNPTALA